MEYFNSMVKELLTAGWKLNDILDSPLYYLVDVMSEKKEKKEEKSLISAFTGG